MKCLIVDDHMLIREALHGVLKELKGEAVVCSQTRRALPRAAANTRVPRHGRRFARTRPSPRNCSQASKTRLQQFDIQVWVVEHVRTCVTHVSGPDKLAALHR
jgi:hypothetical protein